MPPRTHALVATLLCASLLSALPAGAQQPEGARERPPDKVVPDGTPVPRTPPLGRAAGRLIDRSTASRLHRCPLNRR